jgi:hypothetical protein
MFVKDHQSKHAFDGIDRNFFKNGVVVGIVDCNN